jgi:hypothetical protein
MADSISDIMHVNRLKACKNGGNLIFDVFVQVNRNISLVNNEAKRK